MKSILAIDPGPVESAFVKWDGEKVLNIGLLDNETLMFDVEVAPIGDMEMVLEQVECYGMPVGKTIFETVFWSGRFCQAYAGTWHRMPRKDVKLHLCQTARAKDSNVIQALVDRFAPFEKNKGKGVKASPGFFYGFKADIWQAMALGVTWFDQNGN